jgi:transcriptional regulator with XRE-family HTH domain
MSYLRDADYIESFSKNLRAVREGKGLSMSEVARIMGIELNTLHRIEKGKVDISISTLKAIASALNIPPSGLLKF